MNSSVDPTILIADDDLDLLGMLEYRLSEWGFHVLCAENNVQLQACLAKTSVDLVLLDLHFGSDPGLEVLKDLVRQRFQPPVIILTAYGSIQTAVQAMKLGAFDYLTKPPDLQQLRAMVQLATEQYRRNQRALNTCQSSPPDGLAGNPMLGESPNMQRLRQMIADAAPTDATVLILGESGTGKELVAQAIHAQSPRAQQAFVPVNMAALPANLVEATLFGHEKGAFTGAVAHQKGCCELADHGTLFLDEIGEMDINLQAKLLRFLQERQIQRVGSNRVLSVDVRIVAATNRDPLTLVREGRLREDLYYRLNVLPIEVPPLRSRREDIPLLASFFTTRAAEAYGKHVVGISPQALSALVHYDWPGNVRQLENLVQRLVILSSNAQILRENLPPELLATVPNAPRQPLDEPAEPDNLKPIDRLEKQAIQDALDSCSGNVVEAAQLLGLGQATIYRKIKRYGIGLRRRRSSL